MTAHTLSRAVVTVALAAALAACGSNDADKFIASAETYIAKAEYKAAVIELKNAIAKAPQNARARFLLGRSLLAMGDPVSAATEFRKALDAKYPPDEVYPLLARALVQQGAPRKEILELADAPVQSAHAKAELAANLALAHLGFNERKEAKERIDAALALEPANATARVAQAQLLVAEGDPAGALTAVDAVLAATPNDADAMVLKGDVETALGKRGDALKSYERTVAAHPELLRPRYSLISAYIQAGDVDKASAQVDQIKKVAAGDPRTNYVIAYLAFARGDDAAATESVQKVVQAVPEYLPARYLSGLLDLKRGAYASAEDSLRIVVAKAPGEDGARTALAETYLRRGLAAKAQETLAPVLSRSQDNPAALRLAGEIQLALKKPDLSAQYIQRANALEKGNIGGKVRLAEVSMAKGDTEAGMKELEDLAISDPNRREPDLALIAAHLRARDFDKALAAANALVKKQPTSAIAYNALASVYMLKGDLKAARPAFEKALALDPDFTVAAFNLARMDRAEGNFDGAKKHLTQILAKNPKSDLALLGLADLLVATKAPQAEVTAAIQKAIDANPNSVPARLALIRYLAGQKDWKSALTAAQAAQAAIPDTPSILEALAAVQQAVGENNLAVETYGQLAKLQSDNPLPLMRMAGVQSALKDYSGAITSLKAALAIAPDSSAVWVALATAYVNANRVEDGLADARKLQKERPSKAAGYAIEGELHAAQKQTAEASAAYRNALARGPVAYSVIRQYALLSTLDKTDEAKALAQKWLKENPKDVQVRAFLGQERLAKGDYKGAVPLYRAALENDPNNVFLLNNLAWSMAESNDPKAVEIAERAYRTAPNLPEVADTYGWILVQKGDTARGIELLRHAVELAPKDAEKRLHLAQALLKSGDKPGARKELETVAKAESPQTRAKAEQLLKEI
jgi:cellulose synthase operon protein C